MKIHPLPIATMGLVSLLFACDNEAEMELRPAVATFSTESVSFVENDGSKEIEIELSKAVKETGSLTVSLTSDALDHFNFTPAAEEGKLVIAVPQGSTRVSFVMQAIDNDELDGNKEVNFTLQEASRGLQVGPRNRLKSTWVDNESPSQIAFALDKSNLLESATTGRIVTLALSHAVPGDGQLTISFTDQEAVYGTDFTTVPAAESNNLVLPVVKGATQVSFVVNPLNDALFNADRSIHFNIEDVSSVLAKGGLVEHQLIINDDELAGRPKAYYTGSGHGWSSRRQIFYALDGRVDRVQWEQSTPGATGGEHKYIYNEEGLIEKVIVSPITYIKYIRENGKIVKSEEYDNEELDRYTFYGYDQAGNVGEVAINDRQSDGSFAFSLLFVYLYNTDGNLYKKMAYHPKDDGNHVWISTDTYENYIDAVNPFPIQIIPGYPAQHKLPTKYTEDLGTEKYEYSFSYEFLDEGLPSKRMVSGPGPRETTTYEYY